MAKLNGVTVTSEKIVYNGVEYARTDKNPQVGDIIRLHGDDGCSYLTGGGYYEVTRLDRAEDAQIMDDDGDEFDTAGLDEAYTVFAKVSEVAAPVHERLRVGELAKVIANSAGHSAKIGDVVRIVLDDHSSLPFKCETEAGGEISDPWFMESDIERLVSVTSDDTVTVDGVQYRKVKRKAAVGEKIVFTRSNCAFKVGDVVTVHKDAHIKDDGISYVNGVYGTYGGGEYAVLEPVDTAKPDIPAKLPSDYVIHDGAVYRKEAREAGVGELVSVYGHVTPKANGIFTVEKLVSGGIRYRIDSGAMYGTPYGRGQNYAVLVPTDTVTLGGVDYALVKRKAAKGDVVLVARELSHNSGSFKIGEIYEIDRIGTLGMPVTTAKGTVRDEQIIVLIPKSATLSVATQTHTYREVKRKANVGERIRIVAAYMSGDRYRNGDEYVVSRLDSDGDVRIETAKGEAFVADMEYVVMEPGATPAPVKQQSISVGDTVTLVNGGDFPLLGFKAGEPVIVRSTTSTHSNGKYPIQVTSKSGRIGYTTFDNVVTANQPEPPQPERLTVGDYAKVVNNDGSCFKIGEIVIVKEVDESDDEIPFRADGVTSKGSDGSGWDWFKTGQLVRATDEDVCNERRYNVGDFVKVVRHGGGHNYDIGDIVEVTEGGGDFALFSGRVVSTGRLGSCLASGQVEKASDEEVAAARRKSVKVGDYVRITESQANWPVGTIVKVTEINALGTESDAIRATGGYGTYLSSQYEPVTVDEAEAARKQAEEGAKPKITVGATVKLAIPEGGYPAHGWGSVENGAIGTVKSLNGERVTVNFPSQSSWVGKISEFTLVTEEEAAKIAEEAKWNAIGRKVGEFKVGDIVRITKDGACQSKHRKGDIGTVGTVEERFIDVVTTRESSIGGWVRPNSGYVELITPVEAIFTR